MTRKTRQLGRKRRSRETRELGQVRIEKMARKLTNFQLGMDSMNQVVATDKKISLMKKRKN